MPTNHRLLLAARPAGIPGPANFTADALPARAPVPGEVLLETLYLSIDPAMRSWMSEGAGYQQGIPLGEVMRGGGIGSVLESRAEGFSPGDLVQARLGWQTHPTIAGRYLQKLDLALGTVEDWIGPLGLSAVTAWFGLRDIGGLRPNDRVLVSAAAGGVGQIAVQIARIEGCRVAGIAGGPEKCAFVARELGAGAVIDYKAEQDLSAAIARACPEGVDLYFDNVGGPTLDAALAHLRPGARVVLCGRISQTLAAEPYGIRNLGRLAAAHGRMQGFLVFNYHERYDEARAWLAARRRDGSLRQRLHVLEGLAQAPVGLGMLFRGENTGKLVVRV
ncbi:MAG TPA: NADP-dependent oxidoreductase [Burkholderiales bacterium]|jgi:NADPH-dependent curcumin reductase CurA|nr:NADP-dependent oxidoreductase [Burkholderiales bacterium]